MTTRTLGMAKVDKVEGVRQMELSLERVATWTLVFTNAYFLSFFVAGILDSGTAAEMSMRRWRAAQSRGPRDVCLLRW